jgi:hypothetical protein
MARFVEEQVRVVQQAHKPRLGAEDQHQQKRYADAKANQPGPRNRFPFASVHWGKDSKISANIGGE